MIINIIKQQTGLCRGDFDDHVQLLNKVADENDLLQINTNSNEIDRLHFPQDYRNILPVPVQKKVILVTFSKEMLALIVNMKGESTENRPFQSNLYKLIHF